MRLLAKSQFAVEASYSSGWTIVSDDAISMVAYDPQLRCVIWPHGYQRGRSVRRLLRIATTQHPQGKDYAITNHHVVIPAKETVDLGKRLEYWTAVDSCLHGRIATERRKVITRWTLPSPFVMPKQGIVIFTIQA
jgi:hypothetical protein